MSGTVLIVDDDAEIRLMLSTMLSLVGYRPQVARDGLEAWHAIQKQPPDLVILDVMMPQMDGLTLCQKLRSEAGTADLPIIMLSGKAQPEAIEAGLQAGANRYLTKPMALRELTRELGILMQQRAPRHIEV